MAEQDQKREAILEVALKRFKRFGLAKTTMDEIAKDLEISKGSLYYYFSDKERIYVAVVERIVNESFRDVGSFLETAVSVQEVMDRYLSVKERILLEYHFLFGINLWVSDKPSSLMRQIGEMAHQAEIRFISSWIRKGIELGKYQRRTIRLLRLTCLYRCCLDSGSTGASGRPQILTFKTPTI